MAMNKEALADEIIANLEASNLYGSGYFSDDVDKFIEAITDAIIQHLINNTVTQVEITTGSSAGTYQGQIIS